MFVIIGRKAEVREIIAAWLGVILTSLSRYILISSFKKVNSRTTTQNGQLFLELLGEFSDVSS